MSIIIKYKDFMNEEFFSFFKKSGKNMPVKKSRVDECVKNILEFMRDNQIQDWNDYMKISTSDRDIIHSIIDSSVKNMAELEEVRFRIRLELSDRDQLMEYKNELEKVEEYEKCALVVKKITKRK